MASDVKCCQTIALVLLHQGKNDYHSSWAVTLVAPSLACECDASKQGTAVYVESTEWTLLPSANNPYFFTCKFDSACYP